MMEQTCRQAGMDELTRIHGIGDGAPWIPEQYEERFGLQGSFLVDFYHLCESVAAAAIRRKLGWKFRKAVYSTINIKRLSMNW
jgi:hypothetical protein